MILPSFSAAFGQGDFEHAKILDILAPNRNYPERYRDVLAPYDDALTVTEAVESFRQGMLNLLTVGLHHLFEQQMYRASKRWKVIEEHADNTTISYLRVRFLEVTRVDLESLPGWSTVKTLNLAANVVKHGEGKSAVGLRNLRPEIFVPQFVLNTFLQDAYTARRVCVPLAGAGPYLTEQYFIESATGLVSFLESLAAACARL
jgi:hypothetical protein